MAETAMRDLVLGAGAARGFGHAGLLRAVAERKIPIGDVVGVSFGSIVAALYVNGFGHEQIVDIISNELARLEPHTLTSRVDCPRLGTLFASGGLFELESLFGDMVDKYSLRPTPRLTIVAYDLWKRKPVLFQGDDYNLGKAVAASCAVPVLFRPVRYFGRTLIDGGVYHSCPVEFSSRPCIVGKLGLVRRYVPGATFGECVLHAGEALLQPFLRAAIPGSQHIIVHNGHPRVPSISLSLGDREYRAIAEYGYRAAVRAFDKAEADGRL